MLCPVRINRLLLVCLSSFALVIPAFGQLHKELKFGRINSTNGLSNGDVTCITQDKEGFIWIGTSYGLNRFDGYEIKTYHGNPDDSSALTDNSITALLADTNGFIWIGTENNGLSRFNPRTEIFHNYHFDIYDRHSINFNYVTSLVEDRDGVIWIGTLMGLNKYRPETDDFERYLYRRVLDVTTKTVEKAKERKLSTAVVAQIASLVDTSFVRESWFRAYLDRKGIDLEVADYDHIIRGCQLGNYGEHIRCMLVGEQNNLWLGLEGAGLAYFNKRKIIKRWSKGDSNISANDVSSLFLEDSILWVGTRSGGLNKLSLRTNEISTTIKIPWASSHIKDILKDNNGNMWLGNDKGLGLYDEINDCFTRYSASSGNDGLLSESISTLHEDIQGNLWIGSYQGGVNVLVNGQPFHHFRYNPTEPSALTKNNVSSILEDSKGNLWVGYFTTGIDIITKHGRKFIDVTKEGLGDGTVFALFEDSDQNIWVGTYQGGLQKYDPKKGTFESFLHDPQNPLSISGNDVRAITEDKEGNLWLTVHGAGVNKFNRRTKSFKRYKTVYPDVSKSLGSDWVQDITIDQKGQVWVSSVYGVSVLRPNAPDFITFSNDNSNLSHNNTNVLLEDASGNIWVGTDFGLNLFVDSLQQFEVFTEADGLSNNAIQGITQDSKGILWVTTNNGLSAFDVETRKFRNYTERDGLQGNDFCLGAVARGKSGSLYLGGKNGLNTFQPASMKRKSYNPPIYLNKLKLFNKEVLSQDDTGILPMPLCYTPTLHFDYDQNFFSISFAALNYYGSDQNQYSYKLEGFNETWDFIGEKREAVFTNVPPGEYKFRVRVANSDGVWGSEEANVDILISSPIWNTHWAYFIYFLFILVITFFIRRAVLAQIYMKHKIQLDEMKIQFFTNISHEFRTPLALILGPLNELISQKENKHTRTQLLSLMKRNGDRLLRLVNQLMDIYEIDAGFSKLRVSSEPVEAFIRNIYDSFTYDTEKKSLHYHLYSGLLENQLAYIDKDKFEKILCNLIANAIKFTPNNGAVMVFTEIVTAEQDEILQKKVDPYAYRDSEFLKINVEDSGFGIPLNMQKKIFNRFFQAKSYEINETGTGIGLSLANQLVSVHKGFMHLDSEYMEGCRFTVWIPINYQAYHKTERITKGDKNPAKIDSISEEWKDRSGLLTLPKSKPLLLIIDDSEEIRKYIRYGLDEHFSIKEAANGKNGIQLAKDWVPDIILSDVMMPGISGIELCKHLKNDERTSHIPIILLTAKASEEYHLEGLVEGADDYVTKPFNLDILVAKLNNMVKRQEIFKKKFQLEFPMSQKAAVNRKDEAFLSKSYELIEKNLSDSNFGPDQMAKEMGMSRSVLYRKVSGLTGDSVSIFIRNYRLNRASKILAGKPIPIKELSFQVGFSDPSYFTSCFKKMFGVSPKGFYAKITEEY